MRVTPTIARKPGRPHLDGSPPGSGEYLRRISATVPREYAVRIEDLGDGNRSAGVRFLVEFYEEMTFGSARTLAQGEEIFRRLAEQ